MIKYLIISYPGRNELRCETDPCSDFIGTGGQHRHRCRSDVKTTALVAAVLDVGIRKSDQPCLASIDSLPSA